MAKLDDTINALKQLPLFQATYHEWDLTFSKSLTSPYCPSVRIAPEGWNMLRYTAWADTIEEAVEKIADHIRAEFVDKTIRGHGAPITNPHDKLFYEWLLGYVAGKPDKLPPLPREKRERPLTKTQTDEFTLGQGPISDGDKTL